MKRPWFHLMPDTRLPEGFAENHRGADARVLPVSDARRLADGVSGRVGSRSVEGAGHTAEIHRPEAVAEAVLAFLG